ncbi:mRNA 3'-end-processing protein RNA14 [Psilocybe cubensis]|uniref:mRNA 3'-end-processing protein RNA14 n=2 Tax=Psilocybe cubensis TaxID=181762 RepID=A0A8H7XLW4_PSICU|nr:mRNA 3'-end-processing protein RNA14 [Psilocybe cubensis]KAH9483272.1 mRNA 3'-end-processing protein RNA14 [Psilocybe cubensis]
MATISAAKDDVDGDSYMDDSERTQPTAEILKELADIKKLDEQQSEQSQLPPPSEYEVLTVQLSENPHDPDGWRRLIKLAEQSNDLEKISKSYDALLKHYPNNAPAQIAYIKHYVNHNMSESAEDLFKKFLIRSPCVELWVYYLDYVRKLNTGPAQRDTVRMSFEFALNHVGQDKDSGVIWSEYIKFLQSGEATTTWDQQQKMDSLRKVYHRAVQIPLDNVESLWHDLETFENGLNKITAKKFMADLSPAHMQARTVLRQLINHIGPLFANEKDTLFLPSLPKFDASERALVGKWKAYLKWEESNPLELDEKDKATLISRIQGVYRKAVIRMRYYTEIWFMAYTWTNSIGKNDEALSILKAGLDANPSSFLLNFAYAEALEIKKDLAGVHATYEKFLGILRTNLDRLEETSKADAAANGSQSNGTNAPPPTAPAIIPEPPSNVSSFSSQGSQDDKPPKTTELQKHRTEYGLAWIMYMRFGMRAEGVKGSRTIFGKARRDRWSPWEIYEAAALTEYHCSDDKGVASRIFEKGMESFGDEIDFVLRYLGFLISINDKNNARALFERVITTFPPDRARPLWERWARYEYQYGDLEAALKLEKRMAEVYTSDPPIKRLAQRHIYLGTDAIADRDLGFALARRATTSVASSSLNRVEASQSLISLPTNSQSNSQTYGNKRPSSPDYRNKRDETRPNDYSSTHKRARPSSPPPRAQQDRERDRDRDGRWDGSGPPRRRFSPPPPPPNRDRDDRPPPPRREPLPPPRDRDDDKRQSTLPAILPWFIGELPTASSFDGPVFRTDDLMNLLRTAVIPSATSRPKSPHGHPPLRGGGGRPPPDYGPYQGPNSGGGGRRRY